MNTLAQLLEDQPALVGTLVAAVIGLVIALGVNPTLGAAIGSVLTVAAGIWVRAKVYSEKTVKNLVGAAATQTATAITATDAGNPGVITAAGAAVADAAAEHVLATPPSQLPAPPTVTI
jgi:prepilin signal peptidase PulO-like enzyme (type II secretory pathway)